jgi:hypothetical protein
MAFPQDDEWQRKMRDRYLVKFYERYWLRYIFLDSWRDDSWARAVQKHFAGDTVAQSQTGEAFGIEEKFERWHEEPRVNFALETESCTVPGHEKDGWMRYARSEFLYYAFTLEDESGLDLYTLRFQPLQNWFWNAYYRCHPERAYTMPRANRTRFYRVPITDVTSVRSVGAKRYLITDDGISQLPLQTNQVNLKKERERIHLRSILDSIYINRQRQEDMEEWDDMSQ